MLSLDHLLVPRDFSGVSDRALRHGLDLAARTGATLHVLHADVLHGGDGGDRPAPADGLDALREEMKKTASVSTTALDAVSVVAATRRDIAPAPAVLRYTVQLAEVGVRRAEASILTVKPRGRSLVDDRPTDAD